MNATAERPTNSAPAKPDKSYEDLLERVLDATKAQPSSYATMIEVQKSRHLPTVERRLLEEARLMGEAAYYGWGAGKDKIEGPSIGLALAAARCWGNCAVEPRPMQDGGDSWFMTAVFIDLETGFTLGRQFRQSKAWKVSGRMDEERKEDMRFQIGQSKALRNVILCALPRSLITNALEEAKSGVRTKIEAYIKSNGMPKAVDLIVKSLAKHGVKEQRILDKCSVADRKGLSVDDLIILRGDLYSLDNGQERADILFPEAKEHPQQKPELQPGEEPPAADQGATCNPDADERYCRMMERMQSAATEAHVNDCISEAVRQRDALGEFLFTRIADVGKERMKDIKKQAKAPAR